MRIAYLVGQYPAVNHRYLLEEVRILRSTGFEVSVASVSLPDRADQLLTPAEREERTTTYYINGVPKHLVLGVLLRFALHSPLSLLKGFRCGMQLAPSTLKGMTRHFFYIVQAVLLVHWMTRIGVSHVHVSFSGTVGVIAKAISPITMSWGVYGFGEVYDPAGTKLAEKICASSFVRSVSQHLRSLLMISCLPSEWPKLEYVALGVNPVDFPPTPFRPEPRPFRMVSVGRLSPEKGQQLLVHAIQTLKRNCTSPFILHLVGDGPDRQRLQSEIAARGLSDTITVEGGVKQEALMDLYRETDLFVMASLYEGIPIVLMEAMCMEIPCVAPRITGIPELIEDGANGLLFTPANIDELAAALLKLIAEPTLRRQLGLRARQRILENYNLERNTRQFSVVLHRYLPPKLAATKKS